MKIRIHVTLLFLFIFLAGSAQEKHLSSRKGETAFGVGLGLPYGAIGGRIMTNVGDNFGVFGVFGGIGYHLAGVGYNFGTLLSFDSNSETEFYITAMYGTNGATIVDGLSEYDKVFIGATAGIGIKLNSRKTEGNYWISEFYFPFIPPSTMKLLIL